MRNTKLLLLSLFLAFLPMLASEIWMRDYIFGHAFNIEKNENNTISLACGLTDTSTTWGIPTMTAITMDLNGDVLWESTVYEHDTSSFTSSVMGPMHKNIFVGSFQEGVSSYAYVTQYDTTGEELWSLTMGYEQYMSRFIDVYSLGDSIYLALGYRFHHHYPKRDIFIFIFDEEGDVLDEQIHGSSDSMNFSIPNPGIINSDGNLVIPGQTNGDPILLCLNIDGDTLWYFRNETESERDMEAVVESPDGEYFGYTLGAYDSLFFFKFNHSGDSLWSNLYSDDHFYLHLRNDILSDTIIFCRDNRIIGLDWSGAILFERALTLVDTLEWTFNLTGVSQVGSDFYLVGNRRRDVFSNIFLLKLNSRLTYNGLWYDLQPGWNLLSWPFEMFSPFLRHFPTFMAPAYTYNSEERIYEEQIHFESGKGVWVMSSSQRSVHVPEEAAVDTIRQRFYPGWNLVGMPFDTSTASALFERYPELLEPAYTFDAMQGIYTESENLYPGLGYWFFSFDTLDFEVW